MTVRAVGTPAAGLMSQAVAPARVRAYRPTRDRGGGDLLRVRPGRIRALAVGRFRKREVPSSSSDSALRLFRGRGCPYSPRMVAFPKTKSAATGAPTSSSSTSRCCRTSRRCAEQDRRDAARVRVVAQAPGLEGRFPRGRSDDIAFYDWDGRQIKAHRRELREALGSAGTDPGRPGTIRAGPEISEGRTPE